MEKQINVFLENLEKYYIFDIKQNTINSGANGNISYGIMYKKDDTENKIPIALKTYKDNSKIQFDNEKQFFKDIEKLGVNCDYIVKCYGITHIDEKEYIVMEDLNIFGFITIEKLYIANVNLYKTRTNQINAAITKLKEIKKYLFENKIVHNDLKDDNIMISLRNGDVKLIDFGSSSVIKDKEQLTKKQQIMLKSDLIGLEEITKYLNELVSYQNIQK